MTDVTEQGLRSAFAAVGISPGDVVLTFSNLGRLGRIQGAKSKTETLETYLRALTEAAGGPEGTVVVPTFTYSYARGVPFDLEKSPSELCLFGEFVRKREGAVRALHPHFSFAALGKARHEVCDDVSRSAFGVGSVFDRLHTMGAKILFLGTNITEGLTFFLYIEHMVGVSHCYHKAYFGDVLKGGKPQKTPFFSFVRHLEPGFDSDLAPFERDLKSENLVKEAPLGSGAIQLVSCREVFDSGYRKLQEDPCYFYTREFYVTK